MLKRDFIGIGVSRSGTTWTWKQLVDHPQICKSPKEAYCFSKNNNNKLEQRYRECGDLLKGEYTPWYFYDHNLIPKFKTNNENMKLLLALRNPIDRIFTIYKVWQWNNYRKIKDDFNNWFYSLNTSHKHYRSGNYFLYLRPWLHNFDNNHLHVSLYDDLVMDPLKYIQGIYSFLGIDSNFKSPYLMKREMKPYNRYFKKHPIEMSLDEFNLIKNHFELSILNLEKILKRDLSNWLEFKS